jgi:deoxyribodipyrimidine photo-lyase
MEHTPINVVWFKRDLRLRDNSVLQAALSDDVPVLLLYVFEPFVMADPHYSNRHWQFVWQSLEDINTQLKNLLKENSFIKVKVLYGEVVEILKEIHQKRGIKGLYSHEETGLNVTYKRDKAVKDFVTTHQVQWFEHQTNGVIRGAPNRSEWVQNWYKTMTKPIENVSLSLLQDLVIGEYDYISDYQEPPFDFADAHLKETGTFQKGGETMAYKYLKSFTNERAINYSRHISKPLEARKSCSRLSPYIAYGNLSIRQVYQTSLQAAKNNVHLKRSLLNFQSRLKWHCHFIQKFENASRMEFENVNRGYDTMEVASNPEHLEAWKTGHTGFPLVDACMRSLHETGYLNFRMRAMVVSFLTHQLLHHWRDGVVHLAKLFLDFEVGIHYPQFQMQAGVTGVNTIRIYNPVKQSQQHDPEGVFIKLWIAELKNCPQAFIHEPHKLTLMEQELYQCKIGEGGYPLPIINLELNTKLAKDRLWGHRKKEEVKNENEKILRRLVIPKGKK